MAWRPSALTALASEDQPTAARVKSPKRRRGPSNEASSPSKTLKCGERDPVDGEYNGLDMTQQPIYAEERNATISNEHEETATTNVPDYDSEGFEMYQPPEAATPATVEIYTSTTTSGSDGPLSPSSPRKHAGHMLRDSDDSCQQSSPQRAGECVKCIGSVSSDQRPPTNDARELDGDSSGGNPLDDWQDPPVSYIPSNEPFGPRDFLPGRYRCPSPSCTEPFGPSGKDGYDKDELTEHLCRLPEAYMKTVATLTRLRVMALRIMQGRQPGPKPPPLGKEPQCSQEDTMDKLISDLKELREWERSGRMKISSDGKLTLSQRVRIEGESSTAHHEDSRGHRDVVEPQSPLQAKRFSRRKAHHVTKLRPANVVRVKERGWSQPKTRFEDSPGAKTGKVVRKSRQTFEGRGEDSDKENREAGDTFGEMESH